jgi:hypothetical protein
VALTDADIASALAPAGLQVRERVRGEVRTPLPAGQSAGTCRREDGRFDSSPDEIVKLDDPDLPARVNAGWWRLATEHGLFTEQREFLLAVDCREPGAVEPEVEWVRVRLRDGWDLAGSGVAALRSYFAGLFTDRFVPEFVMVSLDGRVLMSTTVWGNGTVSTIAIRPDQAPNP